MDNKNNTRAAYTKAEWILRIVVAGEFIGHGVLAIKANPGWFKYFEVVGITGIETITTLLLLVGIMDLVLALHILIRPVRIVILWMVFLGFWTALLRPLAGESIWDFIGRFANFGAPLALLYLKGMPNTFKEWFC